MLGTNKNIKLSEKLEDLNNDIDCIIEKILKNQNSQSLIDDLENLKSSIKIEFSDYNS